MDWGRRAVARAYAASASGYAERFGDEFVTNDFDRDVLRRFLEPLLRESTVLDGGCGPGQIAKVVEERGLHAVGVDITMDMLSIARNRLAAPHVACGDLCELPFPGAVFDAVVCWFSVHNLPRQLMPALLAEVRRVLIIGGRVLFATHEGSTEERFTDDAGETFAFTYYRDVELAGLLEDAGFASVVAEVRQPFDGEHQVQKLFASAITT